VVVTDTPGMRDYVTDRLNGLLVPLGDSSAMADAIADVIRDPDLATGLAQAGRARVEAVFNTTAQAVRLAELISSLS
jgi:glycosyltransferase involved in cell wall biosynthesis